MSAVIAMAMQQLGVEGTADRRFGACWLQYAVVRWPAFQLLRVCQHTSTGTTVLVSVFRGGFALCVDARGLFLVGRPIKPSLFLFAYFFLKILFKL
jgi:hypothetical protein